MLDSAQLKRQILDKSESSGIRKKLLDMRASEGPSADDIIEQGQAMEQVTTMKGWAFMEQYLLRKCDPTNLLFGQDDPVARGEARGAINFMHFIDQTIRAKNELLRKANEKSVQERTASDPRKGD
jgi:hypothetical protein